MKIPLLPILLLLLGSIASAQETLIAGNTAMQGYQVLGLSDYSQTFTMPADGQISTIRLHMHWDQASTIDFQILKTLVSPNTPVGGPDFNMILDNGSFDLPTPVSASDSGWIDIDMTEANVQGLAGEVLAISLHQFSGIAGVSSTSGDPYAGGGAWDHFNATPSELLGKDLAFEIYTRGVALDDTTVYHEDFETRNAGWEQTGGEWERGAPAQSYISQAYSGSACWMTGLASPYPNNSNATVESGWFDLSAVTVDPVLSLAITHKLALGDGYRLEIDRDDTLGWQQLGGVEWYESAVSGLAGACWADGERPWGLVRNRLLDTAGRPRVRLRMIFDSDAQGRSQGAAFDDLKIEVPTIVVTDASPYFEGFEVPGDAWSSSAVQPVVGGSPIAPVFERGSPAGTILASAHSGAACWGTNLDGNYPENVGAYLESADCDLSGATEDPVLEFALQLAMPGPGTTGEDGLMVEMDLGLGAGFQIVGAADWYDSTLVGPLPVSTPGWTESSNGWRILRHRLDGAAGLTGVRLRFSFVSNNNHVAEGLLIDDVRIFVPTFEGTETTLGDDIRMQILIDGERELGQSDLYDVKAGEQIEVLGFSPEGALVGGEYYLVAEIFPTGMSYTNVVPDVWVSNGPTTVILQGGVQPPFFVPMQLGPFGAVHSYYYGGGVSGYSCRVQALVFWPAGALNGLYASSDAFELTFN